MVNEDVLIKWVRESKETINKWPEITHKLITYIRRILEKGFPGIGLDDVTFFPHPISNLNPGDIVIVGYLLPDLSLEEQAPIMLRILDPDENNGYKYYIEGIGFGYDRIRDKNRIHYKWGDYLKEIPESISGSVPLQLRVDCRPTENGGPGYHYFYRVVRDQRP